MAETAAKSRQSVLSFAIYDVAEKWKFFSLPVFSQIAFGLICTLGLIVLRMGVNLYSPTAGPFALIYPAMMIATLYGRWQAGLITLLSSMAFILWQVIPHSETAFFADPDDGPRTLVNGLAMLVTLGLAELFRSNGAMAMDRAEAAIEKRELLMHELDHRTKNNLAIVVSLLRLQKNREGSDSAKAALEVAAKRIHSFALANESLYVGNELVTSINMHEYLTKLVTSIFDATFLDGAVALNLHIEALWLPRDRAVAVGLVANEAITNACKHAFAADGGGNLDVDFHRLSSGWELTVSDDGSGMAKQPAQGSGMGSSMMAAFAAQAGGTYTTERLSKGTRVRIVSDGVSGGVGDV